MDEDFTSVSFFIVPPAILASVIRMSPAEVQPKIMPPSAFVHAPGLTALPKPLDDTLPTTAPAHQLSYFSNQIGPLPCKSIF